MPDGTVMVCPDEECFTKALEEAGESKLIVVLFTACWCYPSIEIKPNFEHLALQKPELDFYIVDVDENPVVRDRFKVDAMPTFLLLLDKETKGMIVGANLDKVQDAIEAALKPPEVDDF
eukprot:TRINITY_DN63249_c0_g1_i1.p1 TRINITY_DN63249_c0_g1~~TRINITY_DN63249_c0_g1_i1.p1  ORF type:complete len:119 (-),score=35.95 TRINITY_DN63249_c0_g1_i1:91-447(-)